MDSFLLEKTGKSGFAGYLSYELFRTPEQTRKELGEYASEQEGEGLLDLLDAIAHFVEYLLEIVSVRVFHLKAAGLVEMSFWYVMAWRYTYLGSFGASTLEG